MGADTGRVIQSQLGFQRTPNDLLTCAMQGISKTFKFNRRLWTVSQSPEIYPPVPNATHFEAIAPFRFSTYTHGELFGTPTALGGEHNGTLNLNCIVYRPLSNVCAYILEFKNSEYNFPGAYTGFEPLALATILHIAQSLRMNGLLGENHFPSIRVGVEPGVHILDCLERINAVFAAGQCVWKDPTIRTFLTTARSNWLWNRECTALLAHLTLHSLGV